MNAEDILDRFRLSLGRLCGAGFQLGPAVGDVMAERRHRRHLNPIAPYRIARF